MLSPRVRIARGIVAQQFRAPQPVVLPNPLGEAIAATADRMVDMFFQSRRLEMERERIDILRSRAESEAERRGALTSIDRANLATQLLAKPGEPLGNQHPVVIDQWSEVFGRDVAANPELANVVVMPLTPDQELSRATWQYIQELRQGSEEEQELADIILEHQMLEGETLNEVLADDSSAQNLRRVDQAVNTLIDRVSDPEIEHTPEEGRLFRNFIADRTGTPFRIQAIGPNGRMLMADQPIAATLVAQMWQTAREGELDSAERIDELATSLSETARSMGFAVDEHLARRILLAANTKDVGTLRTIAESPAGRAAVQITLQGKVAMEGLTQLWLDRLPEEVRPIAENTLGELRGLYEAGAPREELIELAKSTTDRMKAAARRSEDLDEDDIPGLVEPSALVDMVIFGSIGSFIGAGALMGSSAGPGGTAVGGLLGLLGGALIGGQTRLISGGVDVQPGTPDQLGQVPLEEIFSRMEASEPGGETVNREQVLGQIIADIEAGETDLATARRQHDLTSDEIRDIRRALREGGGP